MQLRKLRLRGHHDKQKGQEDEIAGAVHRAANIVKNHFLHYRAKYMIGVD